MALVSRPVKRSPYGNAARQAKSLETRQGILRAARALMLERGYRASTIAEIARRAGVHVDTVYELIGRKPVLLRELIEQRAFEGRRRHAVHPYAARGKLLAE